MVSINKPSHSVSAECYSLQWSYDSSHFEQQGRIFNSYGKKRVRKYFHLASLSFSTCTKTIVVELSLSPINCGKNRPVNI